MTFDENSKQHRSTRRRAVGAVFSVLALAGTTIAVTPTAVGALAAPGNVYVPARVSEGVPVPTTPLSDSDCALVIQMTGTVADGLGVYEVLDPATSTPTRTYSNSEAVQFVVLPGGCDQVIDVDTNYAPPAWNPEAGTGGVVFLGGTTLNLNAEIDASRAGFASGHSVGANCDGGDGAWGPDGSYWNGGAGGGGLFGGGGGAGSHSAYHGTWSQDFEFDSSPGGGGTVDAAGAGAPNGDGEGFSPTGGNPNCVGNGGSPDQNVVAGAFYSVGAGAGGGGSYGGGGGACSARSSGAYSAGGGGGGSYTGGGSGGFGGTNTGHVSPEEPGRPGNAAIAAEITPANHYLDDSDARLIMGGAGGSSFQGDGTGPFAGGRGGGVVVLAFDEIVGGTSGAVVSNGGDGATPPNFSGEGSHGSSGSGGGAGGQIAVYAPTVSDALFAAAGGIGGLAVEDTSSNSQPHTGSAGASGGGGGIWFAGVGADDSNTGAKAGSTSGASAVRAPGLSNVSWAVNGGNPSLQGYPLPVTIGTNTFDSTAWAGLVAAANADSAVTFKPIGQSLVDASGGSFTFEQLVDAYPYFSQPDNPKNIGLGCGPGFGGDGLVNTSAVLPVSTLTTTTEAPTTTTETPVAKEAVPAAEAPATEEAVPAAEAPATEEAVPVAEAPVAKEAAALPAFELAVRMTVANSTASEVQTGELVDLQVIVANTGEVAADQIEIVAELSDGLELADEDWTLIGDEATITAASPIAPGEEMTTDITLRIAGPNLEATADIAEARAIDDDGEELSEVLGLTVSRNESGETNTVSLSLATTPTSTTTTTVTGLTTAEAPPTLALTGVESYELALLALALIGVGLAATYGSRRPRFEEATAKER